MERFASKPMDIWLKSPGRKPLVIRGARQVGKTWIVRDLAKRHKLKLIELNFEKLPALEELFSENDPKEIISNIEAEFSMSINPESSLLFLDEIQAAPGLFSRLRWFKEDMPQLPVIAAGSLLDFALRKYEYSMPVGRITYFYLEPMSFLEFVLAKGNRALYEKLSGFSIKKKLPASLHQKCLELYKDYCLIGGMPEVVKTWCQTENLKECIKLQQDLLATFRDDFHKYKGGFDAALLAKIMLSVCEQLGNKFIYSRADSSRKLTKIKNGLEKLIQARVCTKISHTSANGIPLGAMSNEKFFKILMNDIGLVSVQLGLSLTKHKKAKEIIFTNKGGLAEQFVGQQLRFFATPLSDPCLFYWQRAGGRQGEIDYIIGHENRIIPIEVKSGASGAMKSLHQFMAWKNLDLAIRFNINRPVMEDINVKTTLGKPVSYKLISLPLYLAERTCELISF